MPNVVEGLSRKLREFAIARDWVQFQSPKNLSMALVVEAAELVEHFQWLTEEESLAIREAKGAQKHQEIAYEMADILAYLLRIADQLDVDLVRALEEKMAINEKRYPADRVKGSAKKYSDY